MATAAPMRCVLLALNSPGYRSLALGYLRAYAQADPRLAGRVAFETLDLDTSVDPWWVAWRVLGLEPEVLGISVTCWNARIVYEVCRLVAAVRPECAIVLGGPEAGPAASEVLGSHPEVGIVVRGEGEVTFSDLLVELAGEGKAWRVDGITLRRDGEVFSTPDRALVADLDELPSPVPLGSARAGRRGFVPRDLPRVSPSVRLLLRGQGIRTDPLLLGRAHRRGDRLPGHGSRRELVLLHRSRVQPHGRAAEDALGGDGAPCRARSAAPHDRGGRRAHRRRGRGPAARRGRGQRRDRPADDRRRGAGGLPPAVRRGALRRRGGRPARGRHLVRVRPDRRPPGRRRLRLPRGTAIRALARPRQGAVLDPARAARDRAVGACRRARAGVRPRAAARGHRDAATSASATCGGPRCSRPGSSPSIAPASEALAKEQASDARPRISASAGRPSLRGDGRSRAGQAARSSKGTTSCAWTSAIQTCRRPM